MKTFQEFVEEGLKADLRTAYIRGRKENEPKATSFILPKPEEYSGPGSSQRQQEIENVLRNSGGSSIRKSLKEKEKQLKKDAKKAVKNILSMREDIHQRRELAKQRQLDLVQSHQERVFDYKERQKRKRKKQQEREEIKRELQRELQN